MNTLYTLGFDTITDADFARVGGKCASLGDMTTAGVAVPPGFAVTTEAYLAMLDETDLRAQLERRMHGLDCEDQSALEQVAQDIQALFRAHPLPRAVETAIGDGYAAMGNQMPVAVRSSATAEDLPDASFAGQQDTYLWVVGIDDVLDKVRDCWASLFTARAIAYREKNGIPHIETLMSVAVQKMVNAKAAGVAMTLDPNTGDRTRIVIDAAWGLGETVVSGTVTPDNFVVEKVLQEILDRTISDKQIELVGDAARGQTVERPVEAPRNTAASLTDSEVLAVALLAKSLERQKKCPQDIEWAFDADLPDGENLLALQSRPETIWSQKTQSKPQNSYASGMMSITNTLTNPYAGKVTKK